MANVTIHVDTFDDLPTDVDVELELSSGFTLDDVEPSVTEAIENYINSLSVGQSLLIAGIIDSIFGLAGVENVTVTDPATDQTTGATEKRTVGTITVTEAP